jgi:hypothetical protein
MRDSFGTPLILNETLQVINTDEDYDELLLDRMIRQFAEVMMIDNDDELESENEYEK